jgi:hypothetical protein
MEVKRQYETAIMETIGQFQAWLAEHPDERGVSAQVGIIRDGAFNTLGGYFFVTSEDFKGRRNETRRYDNLASAYMAFRGHNAGCKRLWHKDVASKRHLVIG